MWNLPGAGIKPASPALAGRYLTTGSPAVPIFSLSLTLPNWEGPPQRFFPALQGEPVGCGMSGASLEKAIRRGAQADKYWGEGARSSAVSATKPFLLKGFRPGTQEKVARCSVLSFLVKKTYQPLHCHFPLKSTFSLLITYYSSNAIYCKW